MAKDTDERHDRDDDKTYFNQIPEQVCELQKAVLSDRAKLVYMAIYSQRMRFKNTSPNDEDLSKMIGNSVSYIQRGLSELEEKGLIVRRRQYEKGSKRVKKRLIVLRSLKGLST